jgi:hypothetical protein
MMLERRRDTKQNGITRSAIRDARDDALGALLAHFEHPALERFAAQVHAQADQTIVGDVAMPWIVVRAVRARVP